MLLESKDVLQTKVDDCVEQLRCAPSADTAPPPLRNI